MPRTKSIASTPAATLAVVLFSQVRPDVASNTVVDIVVVSQSLDLNSVPNIVIQECWFTTVLEWPSTTRVQ